MTVLKRILLVLNPISGDIDKSELLYWVRSSAATESFALFEFVTTGMNDASILSKKIKEIAPDRVIVAGGDGTITMVATVLIQFPALPLGILPVGSSNGLAVSFGIPLLLEQAWSIALHHSPTPVDGVMINDELCLHLSDLGFNALLVKNYEQGVSRGKIGYIRELLKTVLDHKPFRVRIHTHDHSLEIDSLMVIIANADKYGTGFKINPDGVMNDGFFEVVCVKQRTMRDYLVPAFAKSEQETGWVKVIRTKRVLIEVEPDTVPFQIDGEYRGTTHRLRAEILERFLHLALPNAQSTLITSS